MPDRTMIETVARTIRNELPDGVFLGRSDADRIARSVLNALRDPTKAMIADGEAHLESARDIRQAQNTAVAIKLWHRMIDGALADR